MAQLHFGAGDSIGFGTTDNNGSGTASFAKSALSNIVVGDLLVAFIHRNISPGSAITPPAGWTQVGPAVASGTNARESSLYYYPLTSQQAIDDLPATVTWTFVGTNGRVACEVARANGIDLDNPVDSAQTSFTGTNAAGTLTVASLTTVSASTLLVGFGHTQQAATTEAGPSAATLTAAENYCTKVSVGTSLSASTCWLAYEELSAAGATGTRDVTFTGTESNSAGAMVAFTVGAWTPPAPTGREVRYVNDTGTVSTGHAFYIDDAGTPQTPQSFKAIRSGYASIDAMTTAAPFYVAHHCGGVDAPEESLYAATKAAWWGCGALEISLNRTSDGVWFGCHDTTLDRTSGTTNFDATAHTWAEVQAYQITIGPGAARPYARLEEFLDAYYASHVLFLDPKNNVANLAELLNITDALPGTPTDRIVYKFYGHPNTVTWSNQCRARGYRIWGYFYDDAVYSSNIATIQGNYDLLGMDYTASTGTWTDIKSYGKPVIGHICATAADATTALGKGADGIMASGVQDIVPAST